MEPSGSKDQLEGDQVVFSGGTLHPEVSLTAEMVRQLDVEACLQLYRTYASDLSETMQRSTSPATPEHEQSLAAGQAERLAGEMVRGQAPAVLPDYIYLTCMDIACDNYADSLTHLQRKLSSRFP